MRYKTPAFFAVTALVLFFTVENTVLACGVCAMALQDRVLPPIVFWGWFSAFWFVAASEVVVPDMRGRVFFPNRRLWVFINIFVLFLAGGAILGLGVMVFLSLPPAVLMLYAVFPSVRKEWGPVRTRKVAWVSFTALGIGLVLATSSIYIHKTRTRVDYILQWENTGPTSGMVKNMQGESPLPLLEFRDIIEGSHNKRTIELAVYAFINSANPKRDVPYLLQQWERVRAEKLEYSNSNYFEKVLKKLTGFYDMPENTPISVWRKAWKEKQEMDGEKME